VKEEKENIMTDQEVREILARHGDDLAVPVVKRDHAAAALAHASGPKVKVEKEITKKETKTKKAKKSKSPARDATASKGTGLRRLAKKDSFAPLGQELNDDDIALEEARKRAVEEQKALRRALPGAELMCEPPKEGASLAAPAPEKPAVFEEKTETPPALKAMPKSSMKLKQKKSPSPPVNAAVSIKDRLKDKIKKHQQQLKALEEAEAEEMKLARQKKEREEIDLEAPSLGRSLDTSEEEREKALEEEDKENAAANPPPLERVRRDCSASTEPFDAEIPSLNAALDGLEGDSLPLGEDSQATLEPPVYRLTSVTVDEKLSQDSQDRMTPEEKEEGIRTQVRGARKAALDDMKMADEKKNAGEKEVEEEEGDDDEDGDALMEDAEEEEEKEEEGDDDEDDLGDDSSESD
jgi:hypothetical protein